MVGDIAQVPVILHMNINLHNPLLLIVYEKSTLVRKASFAISNCSILMFVFYSRLSLSSFSVSFEIYFIHFRATRILLWDCECVLFLLLFPANTLLFNHLVELVSNYGLVQFCLRGGFLYFILESNHLESLIEYY